MDLAEKKNKVNRLISGVNKMIKQAPQSMQSSGANTYSEFLLNKGTLKDTVQAKDSTVYQFQKWEYLVKKETPSSKDNLLMWFDELASQGWEIINGQQANLGFYIFKKPSK